MLGVAILSSARRSVLLSGFRDRRARIAVRHALSSEAARALAAVRNVLDAQARPRPPLRERLQRASFGKQSSLTRHSRDAVPRCFVTAQPCLQRLPRHAGSENKEVGRGCGRFFALARIKQKG